MFNKNELNKVLNYILRKYKDKLHGLERYSKSRTLDQGQTPIYDYGIKWGNGDIGVRIFRNESFARVYCHMGTISDYIEINYYDGDDFIANNIELIKELVKDVECKFITSEKI
jgi:hypothetical protein